MERTNAPASGNGTPQPEPKPEFPYVKCPVHGKLVRAYVVCKHVINREPGERLVSMAFDHKLGGIICDDPECGKGDLGLLPECCAVERGLLINV